MLLKDTSILKKMKFCKKLEDGLNMLIKDRLLMILLFMIKIQVGVQILKNQKLDIENNLNNLLLNYK
jgi:hypothetical protein